MIEEIFKRIGTKNEVCIEFGAWDGRHLSNTWALWHDMNWSAILIEADAQRARELGTSVEDFPKVVTYHALVGVRGEHSLDSILTKLGAVSDPDLLSVDIDGDDYYVFESLKRFRPRVIVIEFNPTIPPELDLVQAEGEYFGASALALVNLARRKGYGFVGCTDCNCFFVLDSEYPKLKMLEPKLEDVFPKQHLTYVITSFDGRAFLSKKPVFAETMEKATLGNFLRSRRDARLLKHPAVINGGSDEILPIRVFDAK